MDMNKYRRASRQYLNDREKESITVRSKTERANWLGKNLKRYENNHSNSESESESKSISTSPSSTPELASEFASPSVS